LRIVYRDSATVVGALSPESHQFLQLYIYAISIMYVAGPDAVFAVYSDAQRRGKTARPRFDMEKGVCGSGLVLFCDDIILYSQ